MKKLSFFVGLGLALGMSLAYASIKIPMYLVDGKYIGTLWADNTIYGLVLTPRLHGLTPGVHGFQIYEYPCCQGHARGAGGHWDPRKTEEHHGPYQGNGHLGDLPVLLVNAKGRATLPILAPRLTLSQIAGHAVIIDEGGDNYADTPLEQGGGGAKLACGEVPYH